MIAALGFQLLGLYLACGLLFAIPFGWKGVGAVDPRAAHSSWRFRLIILPGVMIFWPGLLRRWWNGRREPPEERTAHRWSTPKKPS